MSSKKTCVFIDDDEDDRLIFETVVRQYFPKFQLFTFSSYQDAEFFFTR